MVSCNSGLYTLLLHLLRAIDKYIDISYLEIMEQQLFSDTIWGVGYILRIVIMSVTIFLILACYFIVKYVLFLLKVYMFRIVIRLLPYV